MTDPRIIKMNYELRLMELQMALLLPKPPQEMEAAKQENMQRKIEEDTEVTISLTLRELDARIKNIYSVQIANLESRIDCISKALEDLQKQLTIQDKKQNPLPW
jgi:hypothetical protein